MTGSCPTCFSKYPEIHGILYPAGSYDGHKCEDAWHRGASYNPDVLVLTKEDRALMKLARIAV